MLNPEACVWKKMRRCSTFLLLAEEYVIVFDKDRTAWCGYLNCTSIQVLYDTGRRISTRNVVGREESPVHCPEQRIMFFATGMGNYRL